MHQYVKGEQGVNCASDKDDYSGFPLVNDASDKEDYSGFPLVQY